MVSKNKSKENVFQKISTIHDNFTDGQQYKIALAAYFKAENRGFASGQELDDWLEAEHDIMGNP